MEQGFLQKEKERKLQYQWYHNFRSYLEQVRGIEPPCSAWEADILPLNYTCGYAPYNSTERAKNQDEM